MIDPMVSLAVSVHSGRGIFALLLGSGLSRAAGIPTGWEIVLDLIRTLACVEGADCGDDPAAWYVGRFGNEPDYSDLLGAMAMTSAARREVLRTYFEPTEEEREQGRKVPTAAHKAIARLVADGFIKVIVTTNFDRLMERALEEAGVAPSVIASADSIDGAMPLAHPRCTVIKVHGDYLDTRLKNTQDELEVYDGAMNRLLDRVFDDYGLVVCGWSAEWDTALRAAIERCPNRRFATYWSAYRDVAGAAKQLCERRSAEVVTGMDADTFFRDLAEKVAAIADLGSRHPMATPMAVATLKRYLAEDRHRIRLHDLVMDEVERVERALSAAHFPLNRVHPILEADGGIVARLSRYDRAIETLLALLVTGGFWGRKGQGGLWIRAIKRLAIHADRQPGNTTLVRLAVYPALALFYGCGVAAVAAGRYAVLASLSTGGRLRLNGQDYPLMIGLRSVEVYGGFRDLLRRTPEFAGRETPLSERLESTIREQLRPYLPGDQAFQETFDRFEYLTALIHADWESKRDPDPEQVWGPYGNYIWRREVIQEVAEELKGEEQRSQAGASGPSWPLLRAGLFGGDLPRLLTVKDAFDKYTARLEKQARRGGW
jgi:hypothetical protein